MSGGNIFCMGVGTKKALFTGNALVSPVMISTAGRSSCAPLSKKRKGKKSGGKGIVSLK